MGLVGGLIRMIVGGETVERPLASAPRAAGGKLIVDVPGEGKRAVPKDEVVGWTWGGKPHVPPDGR